MADQTKSRKGVKFIGTFLLFLVILAVLYLVQKPDGKLHLVFCDVGQGDAIFFQTPSGKQVLVDGGPNDKVLSCLSSHMPFWDRQLDLVISTHPESDHLTGLIEVFKKLEVDNLLMTEAENPTDQFKAFQEEVQFSKVKKISAKRGQEIRIGNFKLKVLWPQNERNFDSLNESSIVLKVSMDDFCAYLTGDIGKQTEEQLLALGGLSYCPIYKVPHHGSKNSLDTVFTAAIKPKVSVISVGARNNYGHPTGEVIESLKAVGSKVLRTDQNGEVEIVTDGNSYKIFKKN